MSTADDKRLQDQVNAANNPGASGGPCTKCPPGAHVAAQHGQLVPPLPADDTPPDTRSEMETLALELFRSRAFSTTRARLYAERALASDWLAKDRAQVAAKALREAADDLDDHEGCCCEPGDHLKFVAGPDWLRDRADRIGGDRG